MKVSHMLLWILGTTLLAFYFGIHCWGGHQRGEGVASFADVLHLDAVDESMRTIVTCYPSQLIGYEPACNTVRAAVPDRSM